MMLAGCAKEEAIIYGLAMSGLVIRTPDVAAFYIESFARHPDEFVTYKMLRMRGDILTKGQLQLLGIRTNIKISRQFYETLNDEGLLDPSESAVIIATSISSALCSRRDVHKLLAALGPDQTLRASPSNMAAGPCENANRLSSVPVRVSEAVLFPLSGCDKVGQCGCLWTLDRVQQGHANRAALSDRLLLE
jgi:hypothetical protein